MLDRSFRSSARNAFIARSKQRAYECFEKKKVIGHFENQVYNSKLYCNVGNA